MLRTNQGPSSSSHLAPVLREFRDGDFDVLLELDRSCFPRGIAYTRRTLRWFLALPGAGCLVAEHNGKIIAFIIALGEHGRGQIITLDVLAAHRRSGVGSLLLQAAESRLAALGVGAITLETATDNPMAIAFWHKHGYRTEAILKKYYLDRLDAFAMRKTLLPPPCPPPAFSGDKGER